MARMVTAKASTKAESAGPASSTGKSKVVRMKTTAPTEAPKAKKAKTPPSRKFVGKTTGLGIQAFQNQLMQRNYKAKLTDEQLAKAMRAEFPSAIDYTVGHVRGIRSAWNKGKHGNEVPAKPLPEFDAEGNVVKGRTRGARLAQKGGVAKKVKKAPVAVEDEDEVEDEDVIEDEEDEETEDDE